MDKYTSELSRQQEAKDEKRQRDAQLLEVSLSFHCDSPHEHCLPVFFSSKQRRLSKLRKALEKKAADEVSEQEELRKKEEVIIK